MVVMSKKKPKRTRKHKGNPWPELLARLRADLDLTQAEAADRIDAPLGTWRNWEQGRRLPSRSIVRLLQLAFPEVDWSEK